MTNNSADTSRKGADATGKEAARIVPQGLLLPFILVTILFPLWGFANDITNPMVAAFKNILLISNFESSLVQFAFYGGYAFMAIPAAIFIKRFSYKKGVLIGLALYAIGCLLFIPAGMTMAFPAFLLSYFIMTCGLSFLETTANPYILSMGDESTSTRRLNLSQAFNPMGSICGMFVASTIILANLNPTTETGRRYLQESAKEKKVVYLQVSQQQQETLSGLDEIVNTNGWRNNRKLLKKGKEQSKLFYQKLTVLSAPHPQQAESLEQQLASAPSPDKLKTSLNSVMVVLQLKDPPKPTEAEVKRDNLFFNAQGHELALVLSHEAPLLEKTDATAFTQANEQLSTVVSPAKQLHELFTNLYDSPQDERPVSVDAASLLLQTKSSLDAAVTQLKAIPTQPLEDYFAASAAQLSEIQQKDLGTVTMPYALMGGALLLVLILFAIALPPSTAQEGTHDLDVLGTLGRLVKNGAYLEGVIAQTFYVGAQIMCWTFIIQYAESELGISKATAQNCNILAMLIFVSSRFICTFLLHYIRPGALLALLATGGAVLTAGTIFIEGYAGLYCLIGVSACMSLMFPTIYGIALEGLGDDAKLGSAGLILAIGGGCLMPPMQAKIIDLPPFDLGFMELASVRASFVLPLICFIVIALYGLRTYIVHHKDRGLDVAAA